MTALERLIAHRTRAATVETVANATDRIAEAMALEILRDPEFRQTMKRLIRAHFTASVAQLAAPRPRRRPRRKR